MERSPWALKPFINPNQGVFSFRVNPWQMLILNYRRSRIRL